MVINEVLNKNLIDIHMDAKNKEEVIKKMAGLLYKDGILKSIEDYLKDVFKRENIGTTGVGMGIAIPHGKSDSVRKTSIAIARLKNPVEWDSLDGEPVNMVFMLAVPLSESGNTHLQLLSQIASLLMEDEFRNKLFKAKDKEEIIKIMSVM